MIEFFDYVCRQLSVEKTFISPITSNVIKLIPVVLLGVPSASSFFEICQNGTSPVIHASINDMPSMYRG